MTSMIENQSYQKVRLCSASSRLTMCTEEEISHFSTQIQQVHRTCLKHSYNDNSVTRYRHMNYLTSFQRLLQKTELCKTAMITIKMML